MSCVTATVRSVSLSGDDRHENEEVPPRRAGAVWTTEDHEILLAGLREGVPIDDLADKLQRRVSAVQERCKRMLPPELSVSVARSDADLILRSLLDTDPSFDPFANLDRNTGRKWTAERDQVLQQGWRERWPMAELVEATTAGEIEIARRCIQLGLAADSLAVADRLGCEPGGALELRCRMMRDRDAASVWVLVVDGLDGGRHISLHPSRQDALEYLGILAASAPSTDSVTATIAQRAIGSNFGPVEQVQPPQGPATDTEGSGGAAA